MSRIALTAIQSVIAIILRLLRPGRPARWRRQVGRVEAVLTSAANPTVAAKAVRGGAAKATKKQR